MLFLNVLFFISTLCAFHPAALVIGDNQNARIKPYNREMLQDLVRDIERMVLKGSLTVMR